MLGELEGVQMHSVFKRIAQYVGFNLKQLALAFYESLLPLAIVAVIIGGFWLLTLLMTFAFSL